MSEIGPQERLAYDRTHLANERTFAAWIRTGLGSAGLGFAVAHFAPETGRVTTAAVVIGALFVVVGISIIAFGARRYYQVGHDLAAAAGSERARIRYGIIAMLAVAMTLLLISMVLLT